MTAFGLAAGPASAIAVIPRQDWWSNGDLFTLYQFSGGRQVKDHEGFKLYIPKQLFPNEVDGSSLPGSYCLDSTVGDVNSSCPSVGFDELLRVFDLTDLQTDNLTISDYSDSKGATLNRQMAIVQIPEFTYMTNRTGKAVSQSKAWTQSQVLANYLSLGWQSGISDDPYTIQTKVGGNRLRSPYVILSCEMEPSKNYSRDLGYFEDPQGLKQLAPGSRGFVDIRRIWNETTLAKSSNTMVEWRDFFNDTDKPTLAAFILSPSENNGTSNNVTMCGVEAQWETIDMSIISNGAGVITSSISWYLISATPARKEDVVIPLISVHKTWADSLNAASSNSSTKLADLIDGASQILKKQENPAGTLVDAQTKILSMAVAEGLSRIGAEYNVNRGVDDLVQASSNSHAQTIRAYNTYNSTITLCRKGWCYEGRLVDYTKGPVILNGTREDFRPFYTELSIDTYDNVAGNLLYRSFPEPADIETAWIQISFPMKRYGYGWGFDTVAVKVATVILILHAVIVLAHCCFLFYSGLRYSFIDSLADLVALALTSEPPFAMRPNAADSRSSQTTTIRNVGERDFGETKLTMIVGGQCEDMNEKKDTAYRRPRSSSDFDIASRSGRHSYTI